MLKRLIILILEFGASLAGNLVSGWIQQDVWSDLFTPTRLLGTIVGAAVVLVFIASLESEQALRWNWRWHRFWYLWELPGNDALRPELDFARLELAQGRRRVIGTEIIADGERRDLIEVLRDIVTGWRGPVRRALVLGEPGSGKTTGLQRLTIELARDGVRSLGFGRPMPVLMRLGDFQEGKLLEFTGQAMQHATEGSSGKVLGKGIEKLVEKGCVILLFDALDEALGKRREEVLAELKALIESRHLSHVPIVITARTREDPGDRLTGVEVFEIQDLNDEAVQAFIRAYKQPEHNEMEIKRRLEKEGLLKPGGLGRNPFWLERIVASGVFQGNKGIILNKAVDKLLVREWEKSETQRSWQRLLPQNEQVEETKLGLAWLGYRMLVENERAFKHEYALVELKKWLEGRIGVERLRPQDVLGLGRDAQVLVYEPDPVRFRHRLLQESMAAWTLNVSEELLTPQFLERYVRDTDWWETFLILAGLVQDCNALVRSVLGDGSDGNRLFLAIGMMLGMEAPNEDLERGITQALIGSLRRGVTTELKKLAVVLADIVGDNAVAVLGKLLEVEEQSVREGGVDILAEIGNGTVAQLLVAYLGNEMLARHAIKALVRIKEPAVEPLIGALRDLHQEVRHAAATALGQIQDGRAVEPLVGTLMDMDQNVRHAAAAALGEIRDGRAVESLIGALKDMDQSVRAAAAIALGQIRDRRVVQPVIGALRDSDQEVRDAATVALVQIGEPAVGSLIGALRDLNQEVRDAAIKALVQIGKPAVGSLIGALQDLNQEARHAAATALGRIGKPAVEPLIGALKDTNPRVRALAAAALGEIRDGRAVEPLIGALKDKDQNVRAAAAVALGQIGEPAVGSLIGALRDSDKEVRDAAIEALVQIGEPAVGSLIGALRDLNQEVGHVVATTLGQIGKPAVEPLIGALKDTNLRVCALAAVALGQIRDGRVVEPLIGALKDKDQSVRAAAAVALGQIRDGRAVEPLIGALKDKDQSVRAAAAVALGQIRDGRVVQPLIGALRDSDQEVRDAATVALVQIGEPAVGSLIGALRDLNQEARHVAAKTLGEIRDGRAVEPLIGTLKDMDQSVRAAAATALGRIRDKRAVEPLVDALRDLNQGVRHVAATALAQFRDKRAVEPLVGTLMDMDQSMRYAAATALGEIRDGRAVEPLIGTLKDKDQNVRHAAAVALGQIRDGRAVEPLIGALKDTNPGVRDAAIRALLQIRKPAVEPLIGALLQHSNLEVRALAAKALGEIRDGRAVEPLIDALKDMDQSVRAAAATALGRIRDGRAVEPLVGALRDLDKEVRDAATTALAQIRRPAMEPLIEDMRNTNPRVRHRERPKY